MFKKKRKKGGTFKLLKPSSLCTNLDRCSGIVTVHATDASYIFFPLQQSYHVTEAGLQLGIFLPKSCVLGFQVCAAVPAASLPCTCLLNRALNYVYLCVGLCECSWPSRPEETGHWMLWRQSYRKLSMSYLWVLGSKLRSFRRTVYALNH